MFYLIDASIRCNSDGNDIGRFSVVIVSNQGGFAGNKGASRMAEWKKKLPQLAAQVCDSPIALVHPPSTSLTPPKLQEVPFRVFAAGQYDQYRKPLPGIWHALEEIHRQKGVEIGEGSLYLPNSNFNPRRHSAVCLRVL